MFLYIMFIWKYNTVKWQTWTRMADHTTISKCLTVLNIYSAGVHLQSRHWWGTKAGGLPTFEPGLRAWARPHPKIKNAGRGLETWLSANATAQSPAPSEEGGSIPSVNSLWRNVLEGMYLYHRIILILTLQPLTLSDILILLLGSLFD